jgi:hypothetical protein
LARKPEEYLLAGPSCRWNKFKLEIGFRLNYLANDRNLWWGLVNIVMIIQAPEKAGNFFTIAGFIPLEVRCMTADIVLPSKRHAMLPSSCLLLPPSSKIKYVCSDKLFVNSEHIHMSKVTFF